MLAIGRRPIQGDAFSVVEVAHFVACVTTHSDATVSNVWPADGPRLAA